MHTIIVEESRCPKNHPCPVVNVCPAGAIKQKNWNSAPIIDKDNCINCGQCVKFCGYGAFQYKEEDVR